MTHEYGSSEMGEPYSPEITARLELLQFMQTIQFALESGVELTDTGWSPHSLTDDFHRRLVWQLRVLRNEGWVRDINRASSKRLRKRMEEELEEDRERFEAAIRKARGEA